MSSLFLSSGGHPSSYDGRVVRTALLASGRGAGEGRGLAAVARNHHGLGVPLIDLAKLQLLNLVVPRGTHNDALHLCIPLLVS